MFTNGVRIGMVAIVHPLRLILRELVLVLFECAVAVAGSTMLGAVAHLTVATARLAAGATTLGSAWFFLFPSL